MNTQSEHPNVPWRFIAVLAILTVTVGGAYLFYRWMRAESALPAQGTPAAIPVRTGVSAPSNATPTPGEGEYSMKIRLSEGRAQPQPTQLLPLATGAPLSAAEAASLLLRLPALTPLPGEQVDFNLPAEPLPPPRPGQTINDPFPLPETLPTPESSAGPLQVVRFSPVGEIPTSGGVGGVAPFISVTFNQPMIPLATLEDLNAMDVPVQVEPPVEGAWRWLGTKTLVFRAPSEVFARLPKATVYQVTIPAGTTSALGAALPETVQWTFTTPPPLLLSTYPQGDSAPLEPIFFMAFDQRIDPQAVLPYVQVSADGQPIAVTLVDPQDAAADKQIGPYVENTPEGRWLAFKAVRPLPADSGITVRVAAGMPSAEGPLVTQNEQRFSFRTYAPLRIEEHRCAWYDDPCPPGAPFFIRFNNPLDPDAFRDGMLTVQPEIPGVSVNVYGSAIEIHGETRGQTTYTVTVSGEIQDIFGQTLGKDARLVFRVGKATPALFGPDSHFVTLDPSAKSPFFSVYAVNYNALHVKIHAVQPSDWEDYLQYRLNWQRTDAPGRMPGVLVLDQTLRLNLPDDVLSQVDIDLSPYTREGFGHFIVFIEPPQKLFETEEEKWTRFSQTVQVWVQVTRLGLDAFADPSDMLAWVTDLQTGAPLSGVRIRADAGSLDALTDEAGVARFPIPNGARYLTATRGADTAMLPRATDYWGNYTWQSYLQGDILRWYVFDDRKMYRPGEQVSIKGWLRLIGGGKTGDVGLPGPDVRMVTYQLYDPQSNLIATGQTEVNAFGGFNFTLSLPAQVNLGTAYLNLKAAGGQGGAEYSHTFQIQEFRRPEFEVQTRAETGGPYFAGGSAILAVDARYYAGGPLPNAEVTWQVTSTPGNYAPPNWPDFTFGNWRPWWFYYDVPFPPNGEAVTETFTGRTDAAGTHYLRLDFEPQGNPNQTPRPFNVTAEGTVMDVNRQAWTSAASLLVHPADVYIGLRSARYFVERGTPLHIDFIVTDLDGNPIGGRPVEVRAARLEWKYRDGEWQEIEVDPQTCARTSSAEVQTCTFQTPIGGSYRITALVTDALGRKNQTSFTRWVSGAPRPPARQVEQEDVTLIPDKETYQPGEVAEILVQSPFSPAEGLLTVSRSGVLYTQSFHIAEGSATLRIPIEDGHIPNLNIQVDLTGSAPRTDDTGQPLSGAPPRPAYARGTLTLNIPPLSRALRLDVSPQQPALEPGAQTTLDIRVTDANGRPVPGAELAVVVVDEAILALTNYQLTDPLTLFYDQRPPLVDSAYTRASIVLLNPADLASQAAENIVMDRMGGAPMATAMPSLAFAPAQLESEAAEKAAVASGALVRVRADFNPLAVFAPSVVTDARGAARVQVRLPDNLTRYRVMVVAVDGSGSRFGVGESAITARLPLMVRPSAPRFLNFGDRFELPVVIQNQTDAPLEVNVAARALNLELAETALRITVPANDRVEVRFPASTVLAGTARIQVVAVSGTYQDAASIALPVYTPVTTEAFATYGVLDADVLAQPLRAPSGVFPQYGGLEITTSSTALQTLTDAVIYLVDYPFECSEQLASRILGIAALRDVLSAFQADGLPAPAELEAAIARDMDRLAGMQNWDGGFPYWRRGFDSIPFNSIHVAHALVRASQKGYAVPPAMLSESMRYLRDIEMRYPDWYDQQTRWTLSAYALYVRNLSGDRDAAKAHLLVNDAGLENLPLDALGWVWPVLDDPNLQDAVRRQVGNRAVETAGAANFITAYNDQAYLLLNSDRRTDAILLDALMADNPNADLIPKVVNGLLAHRVKGRWGNTQENVFVLLALDRYFSLYESQTPDFVARIWLGDAYAAESEFRGYTAEQHQTLIPMSFVLDATQAGDSNLLISKTGQGRLYYRLGLRYAPDSLRLDPLEMGFVVQRVYEAVDDPDDVYRDENGVWHVRAGARVRVRITLYADNRRYHVALVDRLPAGLEIINPDLAITGGLPPQDPGLPVPLTRFWWWGPWYEHQNLRDERTEAFATLLWDGVYEYTYVARATTPGEFIVPPAKAEEMYSPEVFGRSASDRLIVETRP